MAQFKLASSEIPEIIKLMEQMFPGVQLTAMAQILDGVTAEGTFKKKVASNDTVTLELTITAD